MYTNAQIFLLEQNKLCVCVWRERTNMHVTFNNIQYFLTVDMKNI